MNRTQQLFITLSYHAKMHKLLTHHGFTPGEREKEDLLFEKERLARLERSLNATMETIERKELAAHSPKLSSIKELVLELKLEFARLSKVK